MRNFKPLQYLSFLTVPLTVAVALTQRGYWTYLPLAYVFGFIPLLELCLSPSETNLEKTEEEFRKNDRVYDWVIYAALPVQLFFAAFFLWSLREAGLATHELVGRALGFGILCGILGINVAHELGHRANATEQRMAKALLLTSLYTHFFIEHNRGHHKNVSTDEDPASSRRGENVYFFWARSVVGGYASAWRLEAERLRRQGLPVWSWQNEMIQFQLAQVGLLAAIGAGLGWQAVGWYAMAAAVGFLLLETVNYIEHYGLRRKKLDGDRFERVLPVHSWNSNHVVGRVMLFELSRHSDHHFMASRKYQTLRHHEGTPQMPTGYPGMMLLALVPPAWFYVMHRNPHLRQTAMA